MTYYRVVAYDASYMVTVSAQEKAAYSNYYQQEAHYRRITGVSNGYILFSGNSGFAVNQAVVFSAGGNTLGLTDD